MFSSIQSVFVMSWGIDASDFASLSVVIVLSNFTTLTIVIGS